MNFEKDLSLKNLFFQKTKESYCSSKYNTFHIDFHSNDSTHICLRNINEITNLQIHCQENWTYIVEAQSSIEKLEEYFICFSTDKKRLFKLPYLFESKLHFFFQILMLLKIGCGLDSKTEKFNEWENCVSTIYVLKRF